MEIRRNLDQRQLIELLYEFGGGLSLQRIIRLVGQKALSTTAIIERRPQEREYGDEYEHFYKNVHATKNRTSPTRLHFFQGDVPHLQDLTSHDSRYFGYCDVRPTPSASLSCALIDERAFIPDGSRKHLFLICQKRFRVQLNGLELSVNAFPYIQQDGHIVRCAQAALASIAMYYERLETGPQFTVIGKQFPSGGRDIPSRGLLVEQIGLGVVAMGFDPVVYDWSKAPEGMEEIQHREQIVYRYLESKIPVFVGVRTGDSHHAVVVIGHTFTPDTWQGEALGAYYSKPKTGLIARYPAYHCSTNWIERFIIQDDNMGPYTLIQSDLLQYGICDLVVAPLPHHIYLLGETAETLVAWLLSPNHGDICSTLDEQVTEHSRLGKSQHPNTAFWYKEFRKHVQSDECVLRTCLRGSAAWREEKLKEASSSAYADILKSLDLPENIWQVEVSWPTIFTHSRCCCGEVILDPTTPLWDKNWTEQCWLWLHFPGVILYRDLATNKQRGIVLEHEDLVRQHHFTIADTLAAT